MRWPANRQRPIWNALRPQLADEDVLGFSYDIIDDFPGVQGGSDDQVSQAGRSV